MAKVSDRWKEGRRGSEEDAAPLFLLLAMACLLVLMGFFIHGDTTSTRAASTTSASVATAVTVPVESTETATVGSTAVTPTTTVLVHAVRDPVRIVIPVIGVDAAVVPVGLLEDGEMETPDYGLAAWYSLGPAPGEPGPAVMLAHVDSTKGPDVFYDLKRLEPDDEILIYGADGDFATFVVDSVEQQLKAELPKERIWYYSPEPLIRLITCGGKYDRGIRHYLSNVIVYGHLVR